MELFSGMICRKFQDNHITVSEGDGIIILTLTTVDEDDAGQYQCVAENEAGRNQGSVYLSIIREFQ